VSEVDGSAITLGTPTSPTATAAITLTGGYIIRLTVDEGLGTKDIQELYFGVPLANSGLPIPALNETVQDNRDAVPGYERKMSAWMRWVDANAGGGGGGGGVFEEPAGTTLSTLRTGSGATVLADHAFSAGNENTIAADCHYAFVYGGGEHFSYVNEIDSFSEYAVVFGRGNIVSNSGLYSFALGEDNEIYGPDNHVMGNGNVVGTPGWARTFCLVQGENNYLEADQVIALGRELWSDSKGNQSVLLGHEAYARWPSSIHHAINPPRGGGAGHAILCTHLSETTSDDSWKDLQINFTSGSISKLELWPETIYLCELYLIGRTHDLLGQASKLKTWVVRFTVHNDVSDNAVLFPIDKVINATTALTDEASWDVDVAVTMVPSPPQMLVQVKGSAAFAMRWYGVLRTVSYEDAFDNPA
jgi:hypothetical protein